MINKFTKFNNDDRAFSGLEAAIVLIAFVVVAAAFSFAVLNAGFFATQEATGAIHTGLAQATSALQIGGDVVAEANLTTSNITFVDIPVMLAAGGRPIDLGVDRSIITYVDVDRVIQNIHRGFNATNITIVGTTENAGNHTNVTITWILRHDPVGALDQILEFGEIALIRVPIRDQHAVNGGSNVINLRTNERFTITVQPPEGAALTVERTIPSFLEARMILR